MNSLIGFCKYIAKYFKCTQNFFEANFAVHLEPVKYVRWEDSAMLMDGTTCSEQKIYTAYLYF